MDQQLKSSSIAMMKGNMKEDKEDFSKKFSGKSGLIAQSGSHGRSDVDSGRFRGSHPLQGGAFSSQSGWLWK